ncbi:MAG: B12-binding domain-containing protein [Verrucomicrobiales bacterium]|nr:B12-binding domain-containing protein [Verrucomicrobiales bacterium]
MPDLQALKEAVLKGDARTSRTLTEEALQAGVGPLTLLNEFLVEAMNEVGRRSNATSFSCPSCCWQRAP